MPKSKLLLLAAIAAVADGTEMTPSSPEEYAAFIGKDEAVSSKIVRASGAKGE